MNAAESLDPGEAPADLLARFKACAHDTDDAQSAEAKRLAVRL
jgi:hypothetical protein